MSTFGTTIVYFLIMAFLLLVVRWIPPQEHFFRVIIALTWLLWVFVGLVYSLRGLWRFMRG